MANWYDNVPAPVDANGRMVPLDTREIAFDGKVRAVEEICYKLHNWVVRFVGEEDFEFLHDCALPDSWERLEEDARNGLCEYFGMGDAEDCKECPAYGDRLTPSCNSVMARDIIRRAKALAGVDDGE